MTMRDSTDMRDWTEVWGIVSSRQTRTDGVRVFVRGEPAAVASKRVRNAASEAVDAVIIALRTADAELDPAVKESAATVERELVSCFMQAWLGPIFVERSPNGYWPASYPREILKSPWLLVTTKLGHIRVGWRKRVVEIEWSRCPGLVGDAARLAIEAAIDASENLKSNTRAATLVHAYDYQQVIEALQILRVAGDGR